MALAIVHWPYLLVFERLALLAWAVSLVALMGVVGGGAASNFLD